MAPASAASPQWARDLWWLSFTLLVLGSGLVVAGCEPRVVDDPYAGGPRPVADAGPDGAAPGDDQGGVVDVPPPVSQDERDGELGDPCVDDSQCDDGIACTTDSCDAEVLRCRFVPDATSCQDGVYCNGEERCLPRAGCQPGEPVSCSDGDSCTIDRCVEADRSCERTLRDADGDGDPDWRCVEAGGDCDDGDPFVSSTQPEICDNQRDDDCDGEVDESDCAAPRFDGCEAPLVVEAAGRWLLSPATAQRDLAVECGSATMRDMLVAIDLAEPADIVVTAAATNAAVALAHLSGCEDAELAQCQPGFAEAGLSLSRLRLARMPAGRHWVAVFASATGEVELDVELEQPTDPYVNESCAQPEPLQLEAVTRVELAGATRDLSSRCSGQVGERLYTFELEAAADVELLGFMVEGRGQPRLSLRGEACASDELQCVASERARLYARGLSPGRYHVAVSATLPTAVDVLLRQLPVSAPPPGDTCDAVSALALDAPTSVNLADFADDGLSDCLAGTVDAVHRLRLEQRSDVLLVARSSGEDRVVVDVSGAGCGTDSLACHVAREQPVRLVMRDLAAGDYHVVVGSELGHPLQLLAVARPASVPTVVSGSRDCALPVPIAPEGGTYQGDTTGGWPQLSAGCDLAIGAAAGAPEQLLALELSERRRVLIDTQGSAYHTLLNLRRGEACPGRERSGGCVAAENAGETYLDLVLEAGSHWLQVDGLAGEFGPWSLDVFLTEPPASAD